LHYFLTCDLTPRLYDNEKATNVVVIIGLNHIRMILWLVYYSIIKHLTIN